jgi:hypothetical protein
LPSLDRAPIHASNAWNPTGHTLAPVPGCRLYYAHVDRLSGPRTLVLLGDQQHLTFVADFDGHLPAGELRAATLGAAGLYPHLVDLRLSADLPRIFEDQSPGALP